jgi:hypothetical protein
MYFLDPLPPLDEVASRLVESEVAICARVARGALVWKQDGALSRVTPEVCPGQDGTRGTWSLPKELVEGLDPFVVEGLHQSAWFQLAEEKVFAAPGAFPGRHVRGFLGACMLTGGGREYLVYPTVKIHETGAIHVLMRIIAPPRATSLDTFVREYWRASSHQFDRALAPAGLVRTRMMRDVDDRALLPHVGPRKRRSIKERFCCLLDAETERSEIGGFAFDLTPLFVKGRHPTVSSGGEATFTLAGPAEAGYTLTDLAEAITGAVAYSIGRKPAAMVRREPLRLGNHWIARPHIYVAKHHDQKETASLNEAAHGSAFGCMLAGSIPDSAGQALEYLPKSRRHLEDYGLYVIKQATLLVWSGIGLRRQAAFEDANHAHLIYENHVVAEAMDCGYILHCRALELALSKGSTRETWAAQQALIRLQLSSAQASCFGELQVLLEEGWSQMGVGAIKQLTADALEIRRDASTLREQRRASRWRFAATTVLALLSLLGLAGQVITPLWKWLAWPLPSDPNASALSMVAVTLGLLALVVGLVWLCQRVRPHAE